MDWRIEQTPAPKRCDLCGAEIFQDNWQMAHEATPPDRAVEYDARDAVNFLAELWERNPQLVGFLLLRVRHYYESQSAIARLLGMTKASLHRLWKRESKQNPALGRFMRGLSKTRGLEGGRRKPQKGKNDEEQSGEERAR